MVASISQIPNEILCTIFSNADPKTLYRASQVCKRWKFVIEIESLWKNVASTLIQTEITCKLSSSYKDFVKFAYALENNKCIKMEKLLLQVKNPRAITAIDLIINNSDGYLRAIRVSNNLVQVKKLNTDHSNLFSYLACINTYTLVDNKFIFGDLSGKFSVINLSTLLIEDLISLPEVKPIVAIASDLLHVACSTVNSGKIYLFNLKNKFFEELISTDMNSIEKLYIDKDYLIYAAKNIKGITYIYVHNRLTQETKIVHYKGKPFWTWSASSMVVSNQKIMISCPEGSPIVIDYVENIDLPRPQYNPKNNPFPDTYLIYYHLALIGSSVGELQVFNIFTGQFCFLIKVKHPIRNMTINNESLILMSAEIHKPFKYTILSLDV